MKKIIAISILLIFNLSANPNFTEVAERVLPLTVNISTKSIVKDSISNPFEALFFGRAEERPSTEAGTSLGSGFFISKDGLIVTNNHIIQSAGDVYIKLSNGKVYEAKIMGADPGTDIALLKIDLDGEEVEYLSFARENSTRIGEWVLAFGNPFGLNSTMTAGLISSQGQSALSLESYKNFIQVDININKNNSGGPLVNTKGEVIGINTALINKENENLNLGFAIPSSIVERVVDNLVKFGEVKRPMLGIVYETNFDISKAREQGLNAPVGAMVARVLEGTPAHNIGIQSNDVIVAINGRKVETYIQAEDIISFFSPGEQIQIDLYRNGRLRNFRATLIEQDILLSSDGIDVMGMTIALLDGQKRREYNFPNNKRGVIITNVERGSLAEQLGLRAGLLITEVNKEKIESLIDFNIAYNKISPASNFLIYVESKDFGRYVLIRKD